MWEPTPTNSASTAAAFLHQQYSGTSVTCSPNHTVPNLTVFTTPQRKQKEVEASSSGNPASTITSPSSNFLDWTLEQVSCGRLCTAPYSPVDDSRLVNRADQTAVKVKADSLLKRTMTTAAMENEEKEASASSDPQQQQQQAFNGAGLRQTAAMARGFADDAGRAIGNLLPTATLQQLTTRKYTLPDKTVASQVLMYRQLLHTKCRPGLKLSRDYQGTAAQMAVMHMPWWEEGIETTKKMVISYDNLITRLWLNGAIDPFNRDVKVESKNEDIVDFFDVGMPASPAEASSEIATVSSIETFITEEGLPPIPHEFWVDRLGFQQPDPVTDFRSGGVLSLGMLVYMVESQPEISQRFFTGDAKVLPFGITCINVTDMIAKFLMLAKATDRMDALMSQKPFWKMFADPSAILAVQELAMGMLADVVVELEKERKVPALAKLHSNGTPGEPSDKVRCG